MGEVCKRPPAAFKRMPITLACAHQYFMREGGFRRDKTQGATHQRILAARGEGWYLVALRWHLGHGDAMRPSGRMRTCYVDWGPAAVQVARGAGPYCKLYWPCINCCVDCMKKARADTNRWPQNGPRFRSKWTPFGRI